MKTRKCLDCPEIFNVDPPVQGRKRCFHCASARESMLTRIRHANRLIIDPDYDRNCSIRLKARHCLTRVRANIMLEEALQRNELLQRENERLEKVIRTKHSQPA